MNGRIGRINKLTGDKSVGKFGCQLFSFVDSSLHAQRAGSKHQLGSVSFQQVAPFHRHAFRHGQDRTVAASRSNAGQGDTCIAAGRFDDDRIFLQQAPGFSSVDHRHGDAVFGTAGRVKIFQLGDDSRLRSKFPIIVGQF